MRNEIAMETLCNGDITKEPFLKIDTVWSEADENIENFSIKEEIVSDLEVEASDDVHIAENAYGENHLEVNKINNYETQSTLLSSPVHIFKRGFKNKRHKLENEIVDLGSYSIKSSCPHDTKNFQIINRRLRCGDCRSLVCPECFKIMFSTIHNHFLGFDTSNSSIYLCKFCSFPFQSVCALQAHVRIHTMETPYVCPDCGLIYSNAYFLILHLLNKCFHVYKIVSYKCSRCPNIYFNSGTISKHIQDVHLSCVFRCSCCSLLFDNSIEFKSHVDSTHQKQKVQHLSYFRCNLCSDLVIPSFMYEKHISRHRENSESYEVEYQCLCGDVFSLIGAFRAHIQHCGKKGILPSHWGFLRKNLKSQDAISGENNRRKMEYDDSNSRVSENPNENIAISRKNVYAEIGGSVETFKAIDSSDAMTEKTIFRSRSEPKESVLNAVQSGESAQLEISKQIYGDVNEEIDGSKNCGETEGDSCKIFYDYIPCDHLGYVKAQGPEHGARETDVDKVEKKEEKSPTGANYHVVMELDERTGIMISKKVSSETAETEIEEEISHNDSLHENEIEISNLEEAAISRFSKIKSTTSFFACPFCSVLFPKNHSTFQQFKLHLEYYHADAALNITVNGEDGVQNEIALKQNTLPKKSGSLNKCSEKNKMLLEKKHQFEEKGETPEKKEPNTKVEERGRDEEGEEEEVKICDWTAVHSENTEKCSTKTDFYWTVNLSVESKNDPGRTDSGEAARKKMVSTGCIAKTNEDSETNETEPYSEFSDERISDKMVLKEPSLMVGGKKKRQKTLDEETNADSIWEKVKTRKKEGDLQNRPIVSDCDDDWENSKDSSWSNGGSDVEYAPSRHSHSLEDYLQRPKVMGKIKRESEVWSEFYESLQLAEKLKKNKKKRPGSQLEETKQHSTLAEYSTKRVVKKPKRYRESSESECSYDNGENSENEMETTGPAHRQSERRPTTDEESILDREKRQKLMNKLKNIDQRMVEYLLELATQKGKNLELYKKHFGLGGSRHGHTLRSYRKKVLNGIKLRGRPLKLMRRDQVSKKNDKSIDENANGRDPGWQKTPKKQGEDQERRSKRGRPRKILETAKLKERRRSDKEVDFIEKNFEREETGSSPTKRKRKLSSKLQYYKKINSPEEKDDFSSGQVITGKTGDSGKRFSCAVCREIFQDSNGFREHIVSHRQEDNTYQCMECGECFVVRPSLEKHLHAFHKIRNTDEYIAENECGNPRKECPEEPEKEILKENQCKVCRDQFERAIDLTKHFRIHGMAFLKEFKKDGKTRP